MTKNKAVWVTATGKTVSSTCLKGSFILIWLIKFLGTTNKVDRCRLGLGV